MTRADKNKQSPWASEWKNKPEWLVWRVNDGGRTVWAKLADQWSQYKPVTWVLRKDEATEFSWFEACAITKRYPKPQSAGIEQIAGTQGTEEHVAA